MTLFGNSVPIEFVLYGAIGFLAAWLTALMCFPAVHRRAQRLLRREYEQTPLSMQELRAEKDQLRAGFAAATCDLERNIERLKEKTTAHATDNAKKAKRIERLAAELAILNETLAAGSERERELYAQMRDLRRELAIKDQALDAALREVADIRSEIAGLAPLFPAAQIAPIAPVMTPADGR